MEERRSEIDRETAPCACRPKKEVRDQRNAPLLRTAEAAAASSMGTETSQPTQASPARPAASEERPVPQPMSRTRPPAIAGPSSIGPKGEEEGDEGRLFAEVLRPAFFFLFLFNPRLRSPCASSSISTARRASSRCTCAMRPEPAYRVASFEP